MRNTSGANLAYSLLVIGLGVLAFIVHEQRDDLRVIHAISAVSKKLQDNTEKLSKEYEVLIESVNRVAMSVEENHNLIVDSHFYIHRKNVRLRGLPDLQDRSLVDMFKELCRKKLGIELEDSDIDLAQWAGPTQRDGTRPASVTFTDFHTKRKVLDSARLKLRDTPYVMLDDVFVGSGENLTQLAHEKHVDACYKKISKVKRCYLHLT